MAHKLEQSPKCKTLNVLINLGAWNMWKSEPLAYINMINLFKMFLLWNEIIIALWLLEESICQNQPHAYVSGPSQGG